MWFYFAYFLCNMFLQELKKFSRENWWIYLLLIIALYIVYVTGRGNITEIVLLFLANFLGNLFIMVMQANYTKNSNKIGAIYHVTAVSTFSLISLYGYIYLNQSQYLLWQITYIWAALKPFTLYNLKKDLSFLNEYTFVVINLILIGLFLKFFEYQTFSILQVVWFSLITTGLVSIRDKVRYWLNLIWVIFLTVGSALWVTTSFSAGNLDGVALGFAILTWTVLIFYIKLLPTYLKKNA